MTQGFRLDGGGAIDRHRPLTFSFNGRSLRGYAGDTLASALLANGVRVVARSFKFHRPRGIMSAGVEETNALVQLTGALDEPNALSTRLALSEGLCADSVNCWPSVDFDFGAINERLWRLFPAGFYYKTFMRPAWLWPVYERVLRQFAGFGRAPKSASDDCYEKRFHHCDVLVVGAGPAGLAAALAAGRSGARVTLVDDQSHPGGDLHNAAAEIDGRPALAWAADAAAAFDRLPGAVRLAESTAAGYYDHNFLTVFQRNPEQPWLRERIWKVRAKQVVVAAGAIEQPLVFADNDRPGVMLAAAARTYVHRYAVRPGTRAVVVTNNTSAYAAAADLARAGIAVAAIVDTRAAPAAAAGGIEVLAGHAIVGVKGVKQVRAVVVAPRAGGAEQQIACDLVCMSGGWNPVVHLLSQAGEQLRWDERHACFVPGPPVQAERAAGSANGAFALADCLREGFEAGAAAASAAGYSASSPPVPATPTTPALDLEPCWSMPPRRRGTRAFVDFQNDVTADDVGLALGEGYASVEHVKRYTTAGMGVDQGKTGNINIIGLMAERAGVAPPEVGTTTFRPPYTPIGFGAIAGIDQGPIIIPARVTPLTEWHESHGGILDEAGSNYRRPKCYVRRGESERDAIMREARAVRNGLGIYDGSPLGKIDLRGPDARALIDRLYTNSFTTLPIGRARYGLMLQEDGRLLDDGVVFRLGEHHYLLSTGSGVAENVYANVIWYLRTVWPDLRAYATLVTTQWANMCVCGPRARDLMRKVGTDFDLAPEAFKFFDFRHGKVGGYAARVARVTYTGELSFEVNVPARHGRAMWELLMKAGGEWDITPVGSETSNVLRIEKGFLLMRVEGDGMANPYDVGHGWVINEKKADFVGKRSLQRDRNVGDPRRELVGLLTDDPNFVPPDGSPIVEVGATGKKIMIGHVTAATYSPNVERAIALALLRGGHQRKGETVTIAAGAREARARVTEPIFIDPDGERMRS